MKRLAFLAVVACLCGVGQARGDMFQTFDLTWSGVGNSAMATGQITIDTTLLPNPTAVFVALDITADVTAFSITVSGASAGNGTFGLADFSSFDWGTNGATLDLTRELVGQPTIGIPGGGSAGQPWGTNHQGLAGTFAHGSGIVGSVFGSGCITTCVRRGY